MAPAAFGSTSLVICREIFQGGSEAPGPVGLWMLQKVQERIAFRKKKKNRLILVCHYPLPKLKMTKLQKEPIMPNGIFEIYHLNCIVELARVKVKICLCIEISFTSDSVFP